MRQPISMSHPAAVTFNHGVEGSSPSALTNEINNLDRNSRHSELTDYPTCTRAGGVYGDLTAG